MARILWLSALCAALFAPHAAQALEGTTPKLRVGASAGVLGTLPFGDDVSQDGYGDEFDPALWVHVDFFHADIGEYVALGGFFRFAVAGGYDSDTLARSIDPLRLVGQPDSKMALVGLWGRFFPLGAGRVRPYLSLGLGYATAGATLGTCSQDAIEAANEADELAMRMDGDPVDRVPGTSCPAQDISAGVRRHQGLGISFGLGVRFDPTIRGFSDEEWLLPITLELGYVKNVWLGMERSPEAIWENSTSPRGTTDPRLQTTPQAVASNRPNLDFLGLLITVAFLR